MLDKIYKNARTLKEHRDGHIGKHIENLARDYIGHGYKAINIKAAFGTISDFNRWLIKNNFALIDLNEKRLNTFITSRQKRANTFLCGNHSRLCHCEQ